MPKISAKEQSLFRNLLENYLLFIFMENVFLILMKNFNIFECGFKMHLGRPIKNNKTKTLKNFQGKTLN